MQAEPASLVQVVAIVAGMSATVGGVFSAGGAWMAWKKGLNGLGDVIQRTDKNAAETKVDVKELVASVADHGERLARAETTQEAHAGWIRRVEKGLDEERRRQPR